MKTLGNYLLKSTVSHPRRFNLLEFELLTAVTVKLSIFWAVTRDLSEEYVASIFSQQKQAAQIYSCSWWFLAWFELQT
jgi:hypothetical protein